MKYYFVWVFSPKGPRPERWDQEWLEAPTLGRRKCLQIHEISREEYLHTPIAELEKKFPYVGE